jgi:hypothetical protein
VNDRLARGGETEGGAGFLPGSVRAASCADARADTRREPSRVDGGGEEDAHVGERCRLHQAGRADQTADLVERQLRPYGDDVDRQVGGETQEP